LGKPSLENNELLTPALSSFGEEREKKWEIVRMHPLTTDGLRSWRADVI
jgi:hypothetical protein